MVRTVALTIVLSGLTGVGFARADEPRDTTERAETQREPDCQRSLSFWRRLSSPAVATYCDALHKGRSCLDSEPARALKWSKEALAEVPGGLEARALRAQALLLNGQSKSAHEEFTKLVPRFATLDSPVHVVTLSHAARAALLERDYESASKLYRQVVLRSDEIPGERQQARLLLEAATAVTYWGAQHGREARAYLASAAAKNVPLLRPVIEAAWALSFARDGQIERARALVAHETDSWRVHWMFDGRPPRWGRTNEVLPVLPPGEFHAYAAVVALSVEPVAMSLHWDEFIEAAGKSLPAHLRLIPQG